MTDRMLLAAVMMSCITLCFTKASALEAETLAQGLKLPIAMAQPPGDNDRLFVLERGGLIRIIERKGNTWKLREQPFLTLKGVFTKAAETGALGIAFHPDYAKNRQLFVRYNTDPGPNPDHMQEILLRINATQRKPQSG